MANRNSIIHFCERESSIDLSAAIACARTNWLKDWLKLHLPEVAALSDTPQDHAQARAWDEKAKQMMANRGLVTDSQQKNRLTDIRNALKTINPEHPALQDVGLTSEQWEEINRTSEKKLSDRTTKLLSNPDAIVERAILLLNSHDWYDLAAGLAVLTGRRCAEILKTATFEFKTPYSVTFTGAVKRRSEPVTLSFEIPTLAPASAIIEALSKLRDWVNTKDMDNRQINNCYANAVIKACDRHFKALVPTRDGEDNLYTHLFRAVYATIACHWYCPPAVPELEFRAYIQGHFKILDEQNPELRRSLAASRNYFDYKISDGTGNIDGRLGIKLDHPDVAVVEAFASYYQPSTVAEDDPQIIIEHHETQHHEAEGKPPSFDDHQLISTLTSMLESQDYPVLLTALMGLTGRHPSELLKSGTFKPLPDDPNRLLFSATGVTKVSPLPVLADSSSLLDAIASLRKHPQIQDLLYLTPNQINSHCQVRVNQIITQSLGLKNSQHLYSFYQNLTSIHTSTPPISEPSKPQEFTDSDWAQTAQHLASQLNLHSPHQLLDWFNHQSSQPSHEILTIVEPTHPLTAVDSVSDSELPDPQSHQVSSQATDPDGVEPTLQQMFITQQQSLNALTQAISQLVDSLSGQPLTLRETQAQPRPKTQSPPPTPTQPTTSQPNARASAGIRKVNRAIDAIMDYNNHHASSKTDKWRISLSALKQLTKCGQNLIQRVLSQRHDEISVHHNFHHLGQYHNSKGNSAPSITDVISFAP